MISSAPEVDQEFQVRLMAEILVGRSADLPILSADVVTSLFKLAELHGVAALLYARLNSTHFSNASGWAELVPMLRDAALAGAAWELGHRRVLGPVLKDLAQTGASPLLFKGTALAYQCYASPELRMRGDTDILIDRSRRDQAISVLRAHGFSAQTRLMGEYASYQQSYSRVDSLGMTHEFDLHWELSNSQVLSGALSHEELRRSAVSIPSLHPSALGPSPLHALLIAALHRAQHAQVPYYAHDEAHLEPNRLIWLFDIHLLSKRFDERDWDGFADMARSKGLCGVASDGLHAAASRFGGDSHDAALERLRPSARETPMIYFMAGPARRLWMDYFALPGWRARTQFVKEQVFPPAEYMTWRYGPTPPLARPLRYVWRALAGVARLFMRRGK